MQHFSTLADIPELSHIKLVKSCNRVISEHLKQFDPGYKRNNLDSEIYMPKVSAAVQNAEFDSVTARDSDEFNCTGSRVHKLVQEIQSSN